jgi:N-acetylneuraminic acid mutarotase
MMVVFGGEMGLGENSNTVYLYHFKDNKWSKPTICNHGIVPKVEAHCSVVIGDCMYVYGGYIANEGCLMKNIYSLNLSTLQWALLYTHKGQGSEPANRSGSAMVAHNNTLLMFGGTNG